MEGLDYVSLYILHAISESEGRQSDAHSSEHTKNRPSKNTIPKLMVQSLSCNGSEVRL